MSLPPGGRGTTQVVEGAIVCKNRKVRTVFFVLQARCFRREWLRLFRSILPSKTQKGAAFMRQPRFFASRQKNGGALHKSWSFLAVGDKTVD